MRIRCISLTRDTIILSDLMASTIRFPALSAVSNLGPTASTFAQNIESATTGVTASSVSSGAHAHTLTTSSNGAHTHTVSGTTGSSGSGGAHNNLSRAIPVTVLMKL